MPKAAAFAAGARERRSGRKTAATRHRAAAMLSLCCMALSALSCLVAKLALTVSLRVGGRLFERRGGQEEGVRADATEAGVAENRRALASGIMSLYRLHEKHA